MASSQSNWENFFQEAGIPSKIAQNYASIFHDNRMRLDMLSALDKDVLRDLGIKAVGDSIAILRYARSKQTEMSRYHSPSPEVVAVKSNSLPKKNATNLLSNVSTSMSNVSVNVSSSSRNSASSVSQRTNDNVEVKPNRVSSKPESSSKITSVVKTKGNRKTLSDRFCEYESITKKKKLEEEENEKKRLEEVETLKQKTKGTIFTIQLPSKYDKEFKKTTELTPKSQQNVTEVTPKSQQKLTEVTPKSHKKVTELAPKPQQKVTLVPAQGKTLDRKKQPTSIFDRLEKSSVAVQTQQSSTNKSAVFNRLGMTKTDLSSLTSVEASTVHGITRPKSVAPNKSIQTVDSGSVFSRLGKR